MSEQFSTAASEGQVEITYLTGTSRTDHSPAVKTRTVDEFFRRLLAQTRRVGTKDGPYIAPCILTPGGRLKDGDVTHLTMLAVDLDAKDRPLDLDAFMALMPYRAVAWTTASSRPGNERCRVVFPLSQPLPPAEFKSLWKAVFEHTGRVMDRACSNASRLHYLPSCDKDDSGEHHWIREFPGPLLSAGAVPEAVPQLPAASTPAPERPAQPSGAPFDPLTDEEAEKALQALLGLPLFVWAAERPEEVAYPVWYSLATNLAALAKDNPAIHEACEDAFHDISRNHPRYRPSECRKKFKEACSYLASKDTDKPPGPVRWDTLIDKGAPADLCTGHPGAAPAATARIMARPPRARISTAPTNTVKPGAYLFNATSNTFLVETSPGKYDAEIVDAAMSLLLRKQGVVTQSMPDVKASFLVIYGKRAFYHTLDTLVEHEGLTYLNVYNPTDIVPAPGNCQPILDLVQHLVGGDLAARDYVLGWLAAPLQGLHQYGRPMKMGTALVLHGEQGSGKGTLSKIMELIYGASNFVELGQDALDSRFNDELESRLFVVCNEVMSGTNRSAETANKLKPWVTDATIYVEQKYEKRKAVENTFNIIFTSNDERPVIIEQSDRRYSVFKAKKIDAAITAPIWDDLNGSKDMAAAFFDYLLNLTNLPARGELFLTEFKTELALLSRNSITKFLDDVFEFGWYSVSRDWALASPRNAEQVLPVGDDGAISCAAFLAVYTDYCRRHGQHAHSATAVGRAVADRPGLLATRRTVHGIAVRIYLGLPLHTTNNAVPADGLVGHVETPLLSAPHAVVSAIPSVADFISDIKDLGWNGVSADWLISAPQGAIRIATESDNAVPTSAANEVYNDYCKRRNLQAATGTALGRALSAAFGSSVMRRYAGTIKRVYPSIPLEPSEP